MERVGEVPARGHQGIAAGQEAVVEEVLGGGPLLGVDGEHGGAEAGDGRVLREDVRGEVDLWVLDDAAVAVDHRRLRGHRVGARRQQVDVAADGPDVGGGRDGVPRQDLGGGVLRHEVQRGVLRERQRGRAQPQAPRALVALGGRLGERGEDGVGVQLAVHPPRAVQRERGGQELAGGAADVVLGVGEERAAQRVQEEAVAVLVDDPDAGAGVVLVRGVDDLQRGEEVLVGEVGQQDGLEEEGLGLRG